MRPWSSARVTAGATVVMLLSLSTFGQSTPPELAAPETYDVPGDAQVAVIELGKRICMLAEHDPTPLVRVYGDGRVHVHWPRSTRLAGDYEVRLTGEELRQLVDAMVVDGVTSFDGDAVGEEIERVEAERQNQRAKSGKVRTVSHISDCVWTTVVLRLSIPGAEDGGTTLEEYTARWNNLRGYAVYYPEVDALQGLRRAEAALSAIAERTDLERVEHD